MFLSDGLTYPVIGSISDYQPSGSSSSSLQVVCPPNSTYFGNCNYTQQYGECSLSAVITCITSETYNTLTE